jgi:hypothetical protein
MNKNLYAGYTRFGIALCMVFLTGFSLDTNAQQITVRVINTYAGSGVLAYTGNGGPATNATIDSPSCLAIDSYGNLYINDQRNYCVRKVDTTGVITTIAGTGIGGFIGDGGPATNARLNQNWGVAVDGGGNVYITDQENYRVRRVSPGGIITTIAGTGRSGYSGDSGPATNAKFKSVLGIATDNAGNVFVGDPDTNCIRKITPTGIISTYAGSGLRGFSGDGGPAISAAFNGIFGLATDLAGNLYVCDGGNNCVRKIYTSGIIVTIAGNGAPGYNGDGINASLAQLNHPTAVYVNNTGEVFIADYGNNRIRKISTTGIISSVTGTGIQGYNGDDQLATTAQLNHPIGVVMDGNTNMYIADLDNIRIRKVSNAPMVSFTGGRYQHLTACQYPAATVLNTVLTIHDYDAGATDFWSLLSGPNHGSAAVVTSKISAGSIVVPNGLSYTPTPGYLGNDTFKVRVTNGLAADTTTIYVAISPSFPPVGVITGDSVVCVDATIVLTDNVAGGVWSSANTTAKVSKGKVTGEAAGTDIIFYTTTNPCGSSVTNRIITVNALPFTGTIAGPTAVCEGSTVLLSDNVTGGTWSASNSTISVDSINNGCLATGITAGTDTVIYTITGTVCTAFATHTITVDTVIDIGVISGPTEVCVGSQITLSDTTATGAWSSSNSDATISSGIVTGDVAGTDTILYSIGNSCGTVSATYVVTVDPLPDTPVIISQQQYILSAPVGYSAYQWIENGMPVTGATMDTFFVVNIGNYAVTVTNSYGCMAVSHSLPSSSCTVDELKIFPNPTQSIVYIDWCKAITARITCMDGKEIGPLEKTNQLDLSALPNGDYLLTVYDTNGHKIKTTCISKVTK